MPIKNGFSLLALVPALSGAILSASAVANNDITWGVNSAPPFHIYDGEYKDAGVCDALVSAFQQELPQHVHNIRKLPSRRITMIMKRNKNLCFPCVIKNSAYNTTFLYSDTTHKYAPHGVITDRDTGQYITAKYGYPIQFEQLAKDTDLRFGQPDERRYGKLQPFIDDYLLNASNFSFISGQQSHVNVLAMILNDRIDYTVDYKMVKTYYQRTHDDGDKLSFIPIAEYADEVIEGAVGCTRNEWGKRTIETLNSAISSVQSNSEFQRALERWLGPNRPR
ncbi:hypothetical protein CWC33_12375 [Idiomarina sp. X4]|uniref:hypothetical protein n=1 Tax=Idiomarina sp. X4 TaxID=2055892 RepID=UPI000C28B570|nr:hypothetical protein [Idiomarina sp. X4]ATZ74445.1 hypothetical protein CWC33_12375 [Idiomarina sp. X4]